jgi:hypothetical protein
MNKAEQEMQEALKRYFKQFKGGLDPLYQIYNTLQSQLRDGDGLEIRLSPDGDPHGPFNKEGVAAKIWNGMTIDIYLLKSTGEEIEVVRWCCGASITRPKDLYPETEKEYNKTR